MEKRWSEALPSALHTAWNGCRALRSHLHFFSLTSLSLTFQHATNPITAVWSGTIYDLTIETELTSCWAKRHLSIMWIQLNPNPTVVHPSCLLWNLSEPVDCGGKMLLLLLITPYLTRAEQRSWFVSATVPIQVVLIGTMEKTEWD